MSSGKFVAGKFGFEKFGVEKFVLENSVSENLLSEKPPDTVTVDVFGSGPLRIRGRDLGAHENVSKVAG